MSGNSIGKLFTVTSFGESHGPAIGCVVDGCPPGIEISAADLQPDLNRRKPGQSRYTTQRREDDEVTILSGVFEGKTTGASIGMMIENQDQKSKDYTKIKDLFRPAHADYTYHQKYGDRDYRGGGRSSARETAMRVAAGAIAKKYLKQTAGIEIYGYVSQLGSIAPEQFVKTEIENRLKFEGINATIEGRQKQPSSVYNKMKFKSRKFSEVLDMHAFRVVVENTNA